VIVGEREPGLAVVEAGLVNVGRGRPEATPGDVRGEQAVQPGDAIVSMALVACRFGVQQLCHERHRRGARLRCVVLAVQGQHPAVTIRSIQQP
jgi:hypothetical protein